MRAQTFISSLLAVAALGAASQPVVAQQQVARLYVVKPHAGHEMQFEEALAAHVEWRRENNDPCVELRSGAMIRCMKTRSAWRFRVSYAMTPCCRSFGSSSGATPSIEVSISSLCSP